MINEEGNILTTIAKQNETIIKQNETIIKQNEDIKKATSYVELKLNTVMKEIPSMTEIKWDEQKQEQVPKTVLEVWKSLGKHDKENNNEQY
jgi:hypothetical protein